MARKFYRYPPRPSSGAGTFSDNIVGLQLVDGGGLTQGNFEFTTSVVEKVNRYFDIGSFSEPISLDTLKVSSIAESRAISAKEFRVYPNFDLSEITQFNLYGSLTKRISTSVQKIINFFPAALEVTKLNFDYTTGYTAINCVFNDVDNLTTFEVNVNKLSNPLAIDFSVNSTRNISLLDYEVSPLRNLPTQYFKYSLFIRDEEFPVLSFVPSDSLYSGIIEFTVNGNPFSGQSVSIENLVIRPNSFYTDKSFIEPFDEVEQFLLNRLIVPSYTATFQVPKQSEDGTLYTSYEKITWPIDGVWNLDIRTVSFDNYLVTLNDITSEFDLNKTNLITRFLTTDSFKEFDTDDQRVQKILSIYGRSFDEVKKFIDTLGYMNSVNYTVKNDIPSQLLKNLAETLGWKTSMSPIQNEDFLDSVFGNNSKKQYAGYSRAETPTELNYQYYRNLILNSAYLFKSKGTRKSIESLLRLVGAPEALIEFNEHIYVAGQRINMTDFNRRYAQISGGTYVDEIPVYDNTTFSIFGQQYSGFTTQRTVIDTNVAPEDFPVDSIGYPKAPPDTPDYFFQKGAGWFELVNSHQSPLQVNNSSSTFTGQNFNIQTEFEQFTYGQKYLDRFRRFPYMKTGFRLYKTIDNKKSWPANDVGLRIGSNSSGYEAYYSIYNDKLGLNVKNIDLFLNPSQGLLYDVWYMSRKYNYPIPNTGLTSPYPQPGGIDWTFVNPQPAKKSFFEFAQTFWLNMINVRNRLTSTDGKTSGYPTLSSIYWKYLLSLDLAGIPNDNYTYQTMIDYVNGLGDYWIRLVEQMIPASTIWNAGIKYENSIFHRQKFVYRIQRGCQILPVPCEPCTLIGDLFNYSCIEESITCPIYPWSTSTVQSFSDILNQTVTNYINTNSLTCNTNTVITDWYIDLVVAGQLLIQEKIYTGIGLLDVPSNSYWKQSLENKLTDLINDGFNYLISGDTLYISTSGCLPKYRGKEFKLNVGLDFNLSCN